MEFVHKPVLFRETIEGLNIRPDGIYVDGTLGGAGHSSEIASRLIEGGRLIGIDQDKEAIAAATKRLEPYKDRVTIVRNNYENIPAVLADLGIPKVDGILLDIGVSSYQLDNPERGFSYNTDEPLDMRMDQDAPVSAATILNTWTEEDLTRIIRDYGEERFASKIARRIVEQRARQPLETTMDLASIIRGAIPMRLQDKYGNPCKRTFQAVRIACNRELDVLTTAMDTCIDLLTPHGRLAVITFHSLEDRIVKNAFKTAENPCICPPQFPVCTCGRIPKGHVITRKPVTASEEELAENKRSASAKLRVFERYSEDEAALARKR